MLSNSTTQTDEKTRYIRPPPRWPWEIFALLGCYAK